LCGDLNARRGSPSLQALWDNGWEEASAPEHPDDHVTWHTDNPRTRGCHREASGQLDWVLVSTREPRLVGRESRVCLDGPDAPSDHFALAVDFGLE
jgi:endonuclease/exonuclease/phosphatase family metal-dependent hydrolase